MKSGAEKKKKPGEPGFLESVLKSEGVAGTDPGQPGTTGSRFVKAPITVANHHGTHILAVKNIIETKEATQFEGT